MDEIMTLLPEIIANFIFSSSGSIAGGLIRDDYKNVTMSAGFKKTIENLIIGNVVGVIAFFFAKEQNFSIYMQYMFVSIMALMGKEGAVLLQNQIKRRIK